MLRVEAATRYKKCVLKIFRRIYRKAIVPESFLIKLRKRDFGTCVFPVRFAKFLRTPFLQNNSGWLLLSVRLFLSKLQCHWFPQ